MKKIYVLTAVIAMFAAAACGGGATSPRKVADEFTKAFLVDFDLDRARQYVSPELKEEFPSENEMNEIEKSFLKVFKDHAASHGYNFVYEEAASSVSGNEADIHYTITAQGNPAFTGEADIELEKGADGKWYVTDYDIDRDESAVDFGF